MESIAGSVEYTNCVRSCMSVACYDVIYAFDELEPGEVDVRYTSFKGCFTKEKAGSDIAAEAADMRNKDPSKPRLVEQML